MSAELELRDFYRPAATVGFRHVLEPPDEAKAAVALLGNPLGCAADLHPRSNAYGPVDFAECPSEALARKPADTARSPRGYRNRTGNPKPRSAQLG
jgi:hypothetical protein